MGKVLVIGIDALDSQTIDKHISELPNFRKLKGGPPYINFDGVFPPDSPTSWASIYTGLNPAKHGIVLFVDPLGRVSTMITEEVDDTTIHNKTFWDISGKSGKRVCVIPHLLGYPTWKVNGIMIGRSSITKEVETYPKDASDKYDLSQFRWDIELFPGRNKKKYFKSAEDQIVRIMNGGLTVLKDYEWDMFFISFGELDPIAYSFWNYYYEKDPSYKEGNPYKNAIPDFYKIYDDVIGRFLSAVDSDTTVIIVSDHGIGTRPVKLININEFLRRNELIILKENNGGKNVNNSTQNIQEKIKKMLIRIIDRYDLGNAAAMALQMFPKGKDLLISSNHIEWEKSMAYLTDQSGIKNYPYGGIMMKKDSIKESNYEEIRDLIIKKLPQVKNPDTNDYIVKWIRKREDIYNGEYLERYPDILFELNEEYGAGLSTPAPLFGESVSHNIVPGCHKQHNATFLITNCKKEIKRYNMTLMDVTPTILDLLDIDWKRFDLDGRSIFE